MNIKEIAQRVDKSEKNSVWIDIQEFGEEFGLGWCNYNDDDDEFKIKSYYFQKWICTDTHVGCTVIFLNDDFVGVSEQRARKSDKRYSWLSQESYKRVKDHVVSLIVEDSGDIGMHIVDLEKDWGDGYQLEYVGQPLKNPHYEGEEIEIEVRDRSYKNFHNVYIKGTDTVLHMDDLKFKYNLKEIVEDAK